MSEEYYSWLLVETISLAQQQGKTLSEFLQETIVEWCDYLEGKQIEELIRQGHSPMEAAKIVREKRKNEHQAATL